MLRVWWVLYNLQVCTLLFLHCQVLFFIFSKNLIVFLISQYFITKIGDGRMFFIKTFVQPRTTPHVQCVSTHDLPSFYRQCNLSAVHVRSGIENFSFLVSIYFSVFLLCPGSIITKYTIFPLCSCDSSTWRSFLPLQIYHEDTYTEDFIYVMIMDIGPT